jgi:hypothetical protein
MDSEQEHELLLQALNQDIQKVFSPNAPQNIFTPVSIPIAPTKDYSIAGDMAGKPQYQNSAPN